MGNGEDAGPTTNVGTLCNVPARFLTSHSLPHRVSKFPHVKNDVQRSISPTLPFIHTDTEEIQNASAWE